MTCAKLCNAVDVGLRGVVGEGEEMTPLPVPVMPTAAGLMFTAGPPTGEISLPVAAVTSS